MNTQLPAPNDTNSEPKRGLSRRVRHAIDLIAKGVVTTQKMAAAQAGLSEEHLCRVLKTATGQVYLREKTQQTLANGQLAAARTLVKLLDCESLHVQKDASIHLLRLAGFAPPEHPHTAIHVAGDYAPGYQVVICRRPKLLEDGGDTQSPANAPLTIEQQRAGEGDDDGR